MVAGGRGRASFVFALDTPPSVILTKVRIQGYPGQHFWLWALTFVRVTKRVTREAVDTGDDRGGRERVGNAA
ncbi:hypothetical protein ASE72_08850 [Sphingomonas sp. Leaf20]|nr:hypothetical protein ASE72_08850 [Sphingomonas sp. Leaf20]